MRGLHAARHDRTKLGARRAAGVPFARQTKRIDLQHRLQILLLSFQGCALSRRASIGCPTETLETYIRQLLESHRTPEVIVAWQGGEPSLMKLDFFERAVELVEKYRGPGRTRAAHVPDQRHSPR